MRTKQVVVLLLILLCVGLCGFADNKPDLLLHGTIDGKQDQTYIEVPFDVPNETVRLTVVFRYTGKEEHTTLDLGIEDPYRFRGSSGGNKAGFTISETDATPSYLPGKVVPGRWKLLISVPNIRPNSVANFEAEVYFGHGDALTGFTDVPLLREARWYRGDFHMHTGHSDGQCPSQSGRIVPCPVFITLQVAARRGLDFIAVTDHNTTSHYGSLREMQAYFDRLLLVPGREITTFQGHANLFGPTEFLDFRIGSKSVPDFNSLLHVVRNMGALISINHPNAPTGEICMGCGWRPLPPADMGLVPATEAVNGGAEDGPYSGTSFWEQQLQNGRRMTAIGGSDNHRPDWPPEKIGSIGSPSTVVYASELSVPGILAATRAGHVFIDLTGPSDRLLELTAIVGKDRVMMGDALRADAGTRVSVNVKAAGCKGSVLRISLDNQTGTPWRREPIDKDNQEFNFEWPSDGRYHWLRADVITSAGKLQLLGNPIYLNGFDIRAAAE